MGSIPLTSRGDLKRKEVNEMIIDESKQEEK